MFVNPKSGSGTSQDQYVVRSVGDTIQGYSVHSINRALSEGDIDMEDIDPGFDLRLDAESEEPPVDTFNDIHPVRDVISNSFISDIRMDTDTGYFRVGTDSGDEFDVWMPYLDEGKAAGIFQVENAWTDQKMHMGYNGREVSGADPSGAKDVLDAAYMVARETVPDDGIRIEGWDSGRFKSHATEFVEKNPFIQKLEEEGEVQVGQYSHSGSARGNRIIQDLSEHLSKFYDAGIIDYRTELDYDSKALRITGGGYKKLTESPESADYNGFREVIDYRLSEDWNG